MAQVAHWAALLPAIARLQRCNVARCCLPSVSRLTCAQLPSAPLGLLNLQHWHLKQSLGQRLCSHRRRLQLRTFATADHASTTKRKVVFLGTPEVAADVLSKLVQASQQEDSLFEIAATITQPGKKVSKRSKAPPKQSPVADRAQQLLPSSLLLMPEAAGDGDLLRTLTELQPDLCITAAYGNFLPQKFLRIPKNGTVNIHPSLLPKYRGAAPVQWALQNGDRKVGVSVLFTEQKMDAGPIIAQEAVTIDDQIQAPELLAQLFDTGARLLLENMQSILSGEARDKAQAQTGEVVFAPKLERADSTLDWGMDARDLHNKVRAFLPWPGTSNKFLKRNEKGGSEPMTIKFLETHVGDASEWPEDSQDPLMAIDKRALYIRCANNSVLCVTRMHPSSKKPVSAADFANGFSKSTLHHEAL